MENAQNSRHMPNFRFAYYAKSNAGIFRLALHQGLHVTEANSARPLPGPAHHVRDGALALPETPPVDEAMSDASVPHKCKLEFTISQDRQAGRRESLIQ